MIIHDVVSGKDFTVLPRGSKAVEVKCIKEIIKALKAAYIDERNFENDYFGLVAKLELMLKRK